MVWGGSIYSGWELVDYAAIALAESAPLMLTPGRRCENGKPVPVNDPDWIKARKASEEKAGGSLTIKDGVKSEFYKATDYSPIR